MPVEQILETDVLVIGGGMAGCYAAIKAKDQGSNVILVDKGYTSRSGQTPFAGSYSVFNPALGDKLDEWMSNVNKTGEYLNNRDWTELGFKNSYERYQELISWGVTLADAPNMGGIRPPSRGPFRTFHMGWREFATILRHQVLKRGIRIIDRVMIVDLLKQDGYISGAIGMSADNYDTFVFKAKATVLCTGAGGFKPPGWPISALTSDGDTMAYRAGAAITGKEFADTHATSGEYPAHFGHIMKDGRPMFGKMKNAEGDELKGRGLFLNLEFEAHAGRAPITQETSSGNFTRVGGASSGMSTHKTEGIWPAGTDCSTGLPGLYAAGDALGTMQCGAVYAAPGMALSGASVTGAIAGMSAAAYARKVNETKIDNNQVLKLQKTLQTPLERKGGFSPQYVTRILQNTVIPYFVLYIKKEDRLKAALTIIEFLRDHHVPKLFAKNPHELRLAQETKNMITNAEMRLRASLYRTESRGCHYREDYPHRDDPGWLAWVLLKEENGQMKAIKKPIPEAWWPDLSKPYAERYPNPFPGE